MNLEKITLTLAAILLLPISTPAKSDNIVIPQNFPDKYTKEYILDVMPLYKSVSKEPVIMAALDMLIGTTGEFSRNAILGNNLSQRPMKVEFKNLSEIDSKYANFDALGWKKGKQLYIYINAKHKDAPPGAIAALLSHEALHQDEYNSVAEETYAWTMEAAVWCEILRIYPKSDENLSSLVKRENNLKRMFEKGNYSDKYIKKEIRVNPGYKNLPQTSPGFEDI